MIKTGSPSQRSARRPPAEESARAAAAAREILSAHTATSGPVDGAFFDLAARVRAAIEDAELDVLAAAADRHPGGFALAAAIATRRRVIRSRRHSGGA